MITSGKTHRRQWQLTRPVGKNASARLPDEGAGRSCCPGQCQRGPARGPLVTACRASLGLPEVSRPAAPDVEMIAVRAGVDVHRAPVGARRDVAPSYLLGNLPRGVPLFSVAHDCLGPLAAFPVPAEPGHWPLRSGHVSRPASTVDGSSPVIAMSVPRESLAI